MIPHNIAAYKRKKQTAIPIKYFNHFIMPPHWWHFIIFNFYMQTITYHLICIESYIL